MAEYINNWKAKQQTERPNHRLKITIKPKKLQSCNCLNFLSFDVDEQLSIMVQKTHKVKD